MARSEDQPVVSGGMEVRLPPGGRLPLVDLDSNVLPAGTRLGEFELTGVLGEGGFGIVYLAQDTLLDRTVAIKEYMPASFAGRSEGARVIVRSEHHAQTFAAGLRSFVNEAKLLAQFDHPALVKVFRFWEANGTAYMVMPFYRGITVKRALRQMDGPPDEAWIMDLLLPLLDVLELIHGAHCYHRDIAPDNILLLADGKPLLLDFGAARRVIGDMTQALTVILKPGFAPIEQYAEIPGMRQGAWTDFYALAAVGYFAIAGSVPPPSVARMMSDSLQPLASLAAGRYRHGMLAALDTALRVRPEERMQTADAFRRALLEGAPPRVAAEPQAAVAPPVATPAQRAPPQSVMHEVPLTTQPLSDAPTRPVPEIAPVAVTTPDPPESIRRTRPAGRRFQAFAVIGVTAAVLAVGLAWWGLQPTSPVHLVKPAAEQGGSRARPAAEAAPASGRPDQVTATAPLAQSTPLPAQEIGTTAPPAESVPLPAQQTDTTAPLAQSAPLAPQQISTTAPLAQSAPLPAQHIGTMAPLAQSAPLPTQQIDTMAPFLQPARQPAEQGAPATSLTARVASSLLTAAAALTPSAALEVMGAARDLGWPVAARPDHTRVRIGKDRLKFTISSPRPGYVYIFMVGTDGQHVYQIFPNSLDQENKLVGGQPMQLPRAGWAVLAGGPAGTDQLLVIVSAAPRDFAGAGLHAGDPFPEFDVSVLKTRYARGGAAAIMGEVHCSPPPPACDGFGSAQFRIEEVGA